MKEIMRRLLGGVAVFSLIAAMALTVSLLSNNVVYALPSEESIKDLSDGDMVTVTYIEKSGTCNCDENTVTADMTKLHYKDLKGYDKVKEILDVRPADANSAEGMADQESVAENPSESTDSATADETPAAPTEPTITEAKWVSGEGEGAQFTIKGVVPAEMVAQGYTPEEFYLKVGGDPTPENWDGIQTAQEGVDLKTTNNPDGSISFEWTNTFYCPESSFSASDSVNVSFSVHDKEYTKEIMSPSVTLTQ